MKKYFLTVLFLTSLISMKAYSQNICSAIIEGDNNDVNITCTGVDPSVVERLYEGYELNRLSIDKAETVLSSLVQDYLVIRNELEALRDYSEETRKTWELLRQGELEKARRALAEVQKITPRLEKVEGQTRAISAINNLERAMQLRDGNNHEHIHGIEYLISRGREFRATNLSGLTLRGANFAGIDLSGAQFVFSDLSLANFENVNLSGSKLMFAHAKGTSFTNTILDNVDARFLLGDGKTQFDGAQIDNGEFELASLSGSSFQGAVIEGTTFLGADLSGADFRNARIVDSNFSFANLEGAKFAGATFVNSSFLGAIGNNRQFSEGQLEAMCQPSGRYSSSSALHRIQIRQYDWDAKRYVRYHDIYGSFFSPLLRLQNFKMCQGRDLPFWQNEVHVVLDKALLDYDSRVQEVEARIRTITRQAEERRKKVKLGDRRREGRSIFSFNSLFINNSKTSRFWIEGPKSLQDLRMLEMQQRAADSAAPATEYLLGDRLIATLVKKGIIDEADVNWDELAWRKSVISLWLSRSSRTGLFTEENPFTTFNDDNYLIPSGVGWMGLSDIESFPEIYKSWALGPAAWDGKKFYIRTRTNSLMIDGGRYLKVNRSWFTNNHFTDEYSRGSGFDLRNIFETYSDQLSGVPWHQAPIDLTNILPDASIIFLFDRHLEEVLFVEPENSSAILDFGFEITNVKRLDDPGIGILISVRFLGAWHIDGDSRKKALGRLSLQ